MFTWKTPLTTNGEKSERKKDKPEKQKDEGEHDKEENEENENEEGENEEEESDEGESDEEDSEESEGKGISKKKVAKADSEEENNNNEKDDIFKRPSVVPTRSRPGDSSFPIQPYKPVDASRSGHHTHHPENVFNPAKSFHGNAEVPSRTVDVVEISTAKPSVQFPIWSRPVDSARRLDDAGPVFRSTEFHETEERKANHPEWFFNTPKAKSSDESANKEISKPFVPEIPISKPAFVQVPAWPITTTRPAVRESYPPAVSQSDHGNSRPKWFFNATPKSLDGFNKKESSQPDDIYTLAYKSAAAEVRPWSKPVMASRAPLTVGLPIYRAIDSSKPSTRKVYPRWFFNVKN